LQQQALTAAVVGSTTHNDGYALVTVAFGPATGSVAAEVRLDVEVTQNHVAGYPEQRR
jgi:4'-phosphopantetheinyl transferase EntD